MLEDCIIIGGGVAGLSAANQLVDAGMKPLIIDGGGYPSHRICGEYFSHEALPILQKWDLSLTGRINSVQFIKHNQNIRFDLPKPAGGCSHYEFDVRLLERAVKKGARLTCNTLVTRLSVPSHINENFYLELSNHQRLTARHLIIGTGKLPSIEGFNVALPETKYVGFKAHFEGIERQDCLEMHIFEGGYLGIANIDEKTANIAGLIHKNFLGKSPPEDILPTILNAGSMQRFKIRMTNAHMIFPKWMIGQVPEFGIRNTPNWERVFFIGDAAGGIPPVSGEGLAIAITSGCMAADYLLNSDAQRFRLDWYSRYSKRYFWARILHYGMMKPWLCSAGMRACRFFPILPITAWRLTREKEKFY